MVTVYRVETIFNRRLVTGSGGSMLVEGFGKARSAHSTLYLNFGDEARALEFWSQKMAEGAPADIKMFSVPKTFLERLRATSVAEEAATQFPKSPIRVDATKAADQFGLRGPQIKELEQMMRSKQ